MDRGLFPESRCDMGRFIGIAWDTGDLFTLKVWFKPNGKWQNGKELTCNVIRPRAESEISEYPEEDLEEDP